MTDQVLERFHRALIEEIQTQRPEYLTQPFTVAEIYQNLVPYGSHRDRIGVEMNGDYEDALVRLLAGEGGYLILDSETALESLRAELDAPNPNTGVYRDYAAVDVRLNQASLDLSAEALDQLPDIYEELEAEDPVTMTELAPAEGNATANDISVVPPGVDIFEDGGSSPGTESETEVEAKAETEADAKIEAEAEEAAGADQDGSSAGAASKLDLTLTHPGASTDGVTDRDAEVDPESGAEAGADSGAETAEPPDEAATGERRRPPLAPEFVERAEEAEPDVPAEPVGRRGSVPGGNCLWCRADLPERESLNFCPFCGTDVNVVPCPQCGDEVQPRWLFCASCGTEVGT